MFDIKKKKLKGWQKTIIGYSVFFLIVAIVATSFYFLATSPDVNYGIVTGIIQHSDVGTDITDKILNSDTATPVLENDNITLSITPNGNIELLNKSTGRVWSSQLSDGLFDNSGQDYNTTHSLSKLTYINDKNAEAIITSYDQCINKKQMYVYQKDEKTVRMDLIIGESSADTLIPLAMDKYRFENEILPKLSETEQEFMKRQYTLYYAEKLTATDDPDTLYAKFPNLKNKPLYISTSSKMGKLVKKRLTEIYEKIGYTAEDYEKDNKSTGYAVSLVTVTYKVVYDFTLEGNDLVVNIPMDELEFYRDYPLIKLTLFENFLTSGNKSSILVPSGSGAIINYTPGQSAESFSAKVYGNDRVNNNKTLPALMDKDSKISFPVIALRDGADTVTAIIESGDANADINYQANTYFTNSYFDFTVLQSDNAYIDSKTKMTLCGDSVSSEDITVRYRFGQTDANLADEQVFSAIATDYRSYLEDKGIFKSKNVSENINLMLELIGSIEVKKDCLGLFPVKENLVLTDFDKAQSIVSWFKEQNDDDISVRLNGWTKGGLYRQSLGNTEVLKVLGGNRGFETFKTNLSKSNVKTYFTAEHLTFLSPSLFGGYDSSYTSAMVDGSKVLLNTYSPVEVSNVGTSQLAVISPSKYGSIAESYISSEISNLSIGNLAAELNSDYENGYYDRASVKQTVVGVLKEYKQNNVTISAERANAYALQYVDSIENLALTSGDSSVFDSDFPFAQIVLHGNINYTSELNYSLTDNSMALQAIRYGSGIKAVLSGENSDYEFSSEYSSLYSTDYKTNREKIAEQYNMVSEALEGLGTAKITSYSLSGDLSKTAYSNGTVIYVNSGNEDIIFGTLKIAAMSYLRVNN